MKKILTAYLVLQILLSALFFLYLGLSYASAGTQKRLGGAGEPLIRLEDLYQG